MDRAKERTDPDRLKLLSEDLDWYASILAAGDFGFYLEYVHHGRYLHSRHTRFISKVLQDVEEGHIKRLIVNMPPRHGKSMTISETFPSWYLGRHPDRKVIVVSYGESLARRFGRLNRRKMTEFGPRVFGVRLEVEGVTNWTIAEHGGQMLSVGIGGPLSGEGADLLIVDDPIKNRQEAESQTYREMVWSEWQNTLLPRLQPNAAIVIVMTRWHQDDLVGRLLRGGSQGWTVVRLPCIAEEGDVLGRQPGEALWPEFGFDEAWAEETKRSVGSYAWNSLYQQHPSPPEGAIIRRDWWRFYDRVPEELDEVLQSWDMSFKETTSGSFVVGQVWGRRGANYYLLDQWRERADFTHTIRAVRMMSQRWPQARVKLVEDKANGPAVISTLKQEIPGLIAVSPEGSKESRLSAVSPLIEAGNVYLPSPAIAPWVEEFVEECSVFPFGQNDDQVDAMTQALLRFQQRASEPRIRTLL